MRSGQQESVDAIAASANAFLRTGDYLWRTSARWEVQTASAAAAGLAYFAIRFPARLKPLRRHCVDLSFRLEPIL